MRRPPLALLFVALATGCVEYGVKGEPDDPTPPADDTTAPDIRVDPLAVDFGSLAVGSTSEPAVITVTNQGDDALGLDPVRLSEAAAPFALTALGSTLLAPGGTTSFTVTWLPDLAGGASADVFVDSNDPDSPEIPVALTGNALSGNLTVTPAFHDFGTLEYQATDAVTLTLANDGDAPIIVSDLAYTSATTELTFDANEAMNGALPWTLAPGASLDVTVAYAPTDDQPDEGWLVVSSDDGDEPEIRANQIGNARAWEGFSTGWYIVDDSTNYETTSNPAHTVESYGDLDGYWYEPSGAHGLVDTTDATADFAVLRDYIIARAGAPTPVTGPLNFRTSSTVPGFQYASYSYILCDFWLDPSDDPALYQISSGAVDDGILVLVNGEVLGSLTLGSSGSWPLDHAVPGEVNSLVVILMDNAQVDKYLLDLAFYRDGVMVTGS